ncbi:uncharacterized protein LOC132295912 [Cornus florida]|uniref:uncharacterized protein LOC132295912 n=1 Tax=Cornus florida TaxID=4283 RepID=UPI0028A03C7D|nr:uncharacterized protein LOC132295912 [Cornus florida]
MEDYFHNLFSSHLVGDDSQFWTSIPSKVSSDMNWDLLKYGTLEEFCDALARMGSYKAPGPNGFTPLFFKTNWDAMKFDLLQDDALLFYKVKISEVRGIKSILDRYANLMGQLVNFDKSSIYVSPNTDLDLKAMCRQILCIHNVDWHNKYLGNPLILGRSKVTSLNFISDRVSSKVKLLKGNLLSKAGREVLLKAVLNALSTYAMQCLKFPKQNCKDLTSKLLNFWWSGEEKSHKIKWVSWSTLCNSKVSGSLGFKNIEAFNLALLAKMAWRMEVGNESLLFKSFKQKYFKSCTFVDAPYKAKASWAQRGICSAQDIIKKGMKCLHDRIPVNSLLSIWGIDTISSCPYCDSAIETIDHLLCTCPFASLVWFFCPLRMDFRGTRPSFWLKRWIALTEQWSRSKNMQECDPFEAAQKAHRNFIEFQEISHQSCLLSLSSPSVAPVSLKWCAPARGYLKLNFDAAFNFSRLLCGGGLILRNDVGRPIRVASFFFSHVSGPYIVEGLILRECLSLLKVWGYENVVVEGDCQLVMRLLSSVVALSVIFNDVISILKACKGASLAWVPREGNGVAHLLGKKALVVECGDLEWRVWPQWLLDALLPDCICFPS